MHQNIALHPQSKSMYFLWEFLGMSNQYSGDILKHVTDGMDLQPDLRIPLARVFAFQKRGNFPDLLEYTVTRVKTALI